MGIRLWGSNGFRGQRVGAGWAAFVGWGGVGGKKTDRPRPAPARRRHRRRRRCRPPSPPHRSSSDVHRSRCQDLWGRCCRHDGIAGSVAAGFAFFQAATGSGEPRGRPPSSFSAARCALSLPVSLLLLLLAGPARERRPADRLGKKEEVKVEIEIGRDKECFPWGTA
ncbi:hypothetical protein PVAP13_8NG256901 [Panicum virgatum]|uniref:Uncharacterized protein n=1 Tax=Panicum virgatum TaxID=38727 RepID=A0A8T0PA69_PANVG|nr:hypothetical protein PVAP13_8NG256901 [Panicum virgatum]